MANITAKPSASPVLHANDFNWGFEQSFVIAEGQVKNISTSPLRRVEAVVTYHAKDGTFITSDSAMIAYNPILPGQVSPWRVTTTANPAMYKASVEFKQLGAGSLACSWENK